MEKITALAIRMLGAVEQIGGDVDIEPAVAVVVAKRRHDGRILHVEPVGVGHLLERPVPLVDIEQIRGVVPADIDIQPAIVVHVDKRNSMLPDAGLGALVADPRLFRHIFELKPRGCGRAGNFPSC